MDVGEAQAGVDGDDRGEELGRAECEHEIGRSLHEEAVQTPDEDERLRDDGNLEVDDRVKLRVVRVDGEGRREADTELVLEEGRLLDDDNEGNPESAVSANSDERIK